MKNKKDTGDTTEQDVLQLHNGVDLLPNIRILAHTRTHTHRVSVVRGFPALEDPHPVRAVDFLLQDVSPETPKNVLVLSVLELFVLNFLLPLILLACQIVYGR